MTEKIYEKQSFINEYRTEVSDCIIEDGKVYIKLKESIFFPEEDSEGFKYFIAYVSQAAKGHNGPISYRVSVSGGESVKPLRVTARIYYNKVE